MQKVGSGSGKHIIPDPGSVADPHPEDPYVFGPPGSGSGSIVRDTDTDTSIIKQKL
jgi:hypothetical protein